MPRGPRGEKRPADVIGCAVMVAKIVTGEEPEYLQGESANMTKRLRKKPQRSATTKKRDRAADRHLNLEDR